MNRKSVPFIVVSVLLLCLASTPCVMANGIWPALLLAVGLLSWGPILIGLLLEYLVVRAITGFDALKSLKADLVMNLVSALAGSLLISLFGLLGEVGPLGGIGARSIAFLIKTLTLVLTGALINAVLEVHVLRRIYHAQISRVGFWWLYLANLATTAVACVYVILQVTIRSSRPPY